MTCFKNIFLFMLCCLWPQSSVYALDLSELYHRSDVLEKKTQTQLEKRLAAILPDDLYMVKTEVLLKVIYDKPKDILHEDVVLGKLGQANPLGGKLEVRKRVALKDFNENIKEIKIEIMLDHSIERHFEAEIRNIVFALLSDQAKGKINLSMARILFKQNYAVEQFGSVKSTLANHTNLLVGLGIIMSLLILCCLLVSWVKGGMHSIRGLAHRVLDVMEEKAKHPVSPGQIIIAPATGTVSAPVSAAPSVQNKKNELREEISLLKRDLSHLMAVALGRPIRLTLLVRDWIYRNTAEANATLTILPEILGTELFANIINGLSEEEQRLWCLNSSRTATLEEINLARAFIKAHSHELLADAGQERDSELLNLAISADEYVEIIYKDLNLGAQLLKHLPEGLVKIIFQRLPKNYVSQVIESGLNVQNYRKEEFLARVKIIITGLREDKFKKFPPTYVEHIVQQLREVGPKREKDILDMFRKNGRMEVLHNVVKQVVPSEIIFQMPLSFLKSVLSCFNVMERAEMVVLAQSEQREQLLLCLGEKDSCERVAVDIEIERIENDLKCLKAVKENADVIWREFIKQARITITTSPELEHHAAFLLDRWVFQAINASDKSYKKAA